MIRNQMIVTIQRIALVCLILLPGSALSAAGTPRISNARFDRLPQENGLSQTSVNCMVQDHNGFLWFGTQDGLNRYDGYGFTTFKHDDEIPGSLANNFVWALHVDRNGTLWIGTEGGGLGRWNPADDSFTHYRHVPSDASSLVDDEIRALDEDKDGAIWIGTAGGLSRFSPESGIFRHFIHDENDSDSISENPIRAVLADSVGRIWIGTLEGGLNRKDPASDAFIQYRHDPDDENSLSSDKIKTIREDTHGNIWIGTYDGGLNRLDPNSGLMKRFRADPNHRSSLGHDRVRALFTDSSGTLWVGTDDGLSRLLDGANRFETYRHDPADPNSLSSDRILSIYQDRAGLLWVATQAGLTHRNTAMETFSHGKQDPDTESTLSSNIITGFSEGDDNTLWVGTYGGGLSGLNLESGDYTHLKHDDKNSGSLGDDRVMSLYHDSRGNLWVGTMASGLSIRYAGSKNFIHLRHNPEDPASLSANGVTAITEDGDGTIWIGTYRGGLNRLLEDGRSFSHYRYDESIPTSLSSDQVMSLHAETDGTIWVGTKDGGLNRLDPKTGLFNRYTNDPEEPASLGSNTVWTIYEDSERTLWLGTQGGGLNRWSFTDRAAGNELFHRYTVKNGLSDDLIYGVLEDRSGNLWLSSNQGLSRFNIETEVISNFDTTHGLQSPEFNFGAYFQNEDGVMFFGGNNGFNYFHPDDVRKNDHVPPVVLTGILKMNEKVILEQPSWDLDQLIVDHWDHMVSFDFAALDFSAPEKNRYAYRLEGFDADWIDLGTLRRATYTNLDPGEYTLRVRASNNDGVWNEAGITLPIRVLPPPWKTWWAYSLYATALLLLLIGFVRIQARKLHREEENSRQLELSVRERTEELAIKNIELEEASLTDSLTGLRNRRYFQQHLQDDIALIDREYELRRINGTLSELKDSGLMCLMIDLDGFKAVNDNFGHAAGDLVLLDTCNVLSNIVRQSDTLLRWGGDEFLIVARSTKRESANILAERIRIAISELEVRVDDENTARVGCSLGFAFYPFLPSAPRLLAWEQVLKVADRALYLAKANGKDAWVGISARESARRPDLINLLMSNLELLHHEGAIDVTSNLEPDELWIDQSETKKQRRGDGSAA